jgi:uncharacterized membrane protein (DUF2068 family)
MRKESIAAVHAGGPVVVEVVDVAVLDALDVVEALAWLEPALVTVVVTVVEDPQPASATRTATAMGVGDRRCRGHGRIRVCSAKPSRILPASCDYPRHDGEATALRSRQPGELPASRREPQGRTSEARSVLGSPADRRASCEYLDLMHRPPGTHHPRKRRHLDWELITCGLNGHHLIGTDAAELRGEDWVLAREQPPIRWYRCLRCDSWLPLEPPEHPARQSPPDRDEIKVPLRGKALRDRVVLRLIAIDRAFHFVILMLLGIGVIAFAGHESSLRNAYYKILTALQGGVAGGPVQTSGHVGILHEFDKLFTLRSGTLREVGIGLLSYGLLEGVEAVGLWYTKRWAEYLTFIATTILLPLEIFEIVHRQSALKIIGFIVNVAVIAYLLYAKRLFGLRGGGRVDEELRARDMSWETIEGVAPPVAAPA